MKSADKLNWKNIQHFSKSEFPNGSLEKTSALFIERLAEYRAALGKAITPSPLLAGWIRTSGSESSRHYAVDRLSDAGDIFLSKGTDARYAFTLACQFFNGVGIYYDTQLSKDEPRIMLHVDMRPTPTVWARHRGEYLYPARGGRDADVFYFLLNKGQPQP